MAYDARNRADALRVIRELNERAQSDTGQYVDLWQIKRNLGLTSERLAGAVDVLEAGGLVESVRRQSGSSTSIHARIRDAGVRAAEESGSRKSFKVTSAREVVKITEAGLRELLEAEKTPYASTKHFVPYSSVVFNVAGSVHSSAFQFASPGAQQHVELRFENVASGDVRRIQEFLNEYSGVAHHALSLARELESDDFAELQAEVQTLQAQASSPRPKADTVRISRSAIEKIVARAPGGVSYAPLLERLRQIRV